MQLTFALIKPHIVKNKYALEKIQKLIQDEFLVVKSREVFITKEIGEKFYKEHRNKFFYNRLITFMCSGPSLVFILASTDGISKWRNLMGPTKVFKTIYAKPDSIRGRYGLSDTRNACHGSDSIKSATNEIALFFPEFDVKNWQENESN